MFRTLMLCLEARIEWYIPVDHAIVPWFLERTSLIFNSSGVGPDGVIAWAKPRGRGFNQPMLGFGEQVLYKLPSKGQISNTDGMTSNVYRLCTFHGVAYAGSLYKLPESERWAAEVFAGIKTTPLSVRERPEPYVTFKEPAEAAGSAGYSIPAGARKLRIDQSDLDNYGYTDKYPQCEHAKKYGESRSGGNHSDACRARITECLRDTEACRRRLNEQEFRQARSAVDRDEQFDRRYTQEEQVEIVRACDRAVDAALPRNRAVFTGSQSSGSGQGSLDDPARRASVNAQNDRDLRAAS